MVGLRRAVFATAAAIILPHAPALAEDCLNDWGLAGEIVRREKLITVEEVYKSLAADGIGQIVKSTLCHSDTGYVYRLVIRGPTGQLKSTVMSAKSRQ
jgi:hypothetical protein